MVWIVLPEYKQAESVYWIDPDITKYYLPYVQQGLFKKNDNKLSLQCLSTNSSLFLKGADNPDSLRGNGLDKLIFDETQKIKPEAFNVLSPTLVDSPHHSVLYIGTANGFDNFHDLCLLGDHSNQIEKGGKEIIPNPLYESFRFTSYDNMTWPEGSPERASFVENINQERAKYESMGMLDWFEQEYLGLFRKRAGSVFPTFSREINLIPDMELPKEWRRVRGWDFGSTDATASVRLCEDLDQNLFVERCYKQRKNLLKDHAESVISQDEGLTTMGAVEGFGDPSGAQWMSELTALGCPVQKANRETSTNNQSWVQLGVGKIAGKLTPREGHTVYLPNGKKIETAPSLFVLNRPENQDLVSEFELQVYKKNTSGLSKSEIDDAGDPHGHFDLLAALRYVMVSIENSFTFIPLFITNTAPKEIQNTQAVYSDDERKKLELEADLLLIRQQNQSRLFGQ